MSPKYSSLALEDTVRDTEGELFEPLLTVVFNAHYSKAPSVLEAAPKAFSQGDVVQVKGSITISF